MRAAIVIIATLVAVLAAGCSPLWDYSPRTPFEDEVDYLRTRTSYKHLAIARLKELKYPGGLSAPTISPLRKSHSVAFADWMACVQGDGEGHRRTFAVFYRDRRIADFRHAVVIDGCELEPYERLESETRGPAAGKHNQLSAKP